MVKNREITEDELNNLLSSLDISEEHNKGHGAGGANTNKNGLSFENITDLKSEYKIVYDDKYFIKITFNRDDNELKKQYTALRKKQFLKFMEIYKAKEIEAAHGCKEPDEVYVDTIKKVIFILEKKYQKSNGSVCEKIQTGPFKKWHYENMYPDFTIEYIYCLSNWFKDNCKVELEYLKKNKIPVFWAEASNYKKEIVDYIINYRLLPQ